LQTASISNRLGFKIWQDFKCTDRCPKSQPIRRDYPKYWSIAEINKVDWTKNQ
jgi:hypothetical protein